MMIFSYKYTICHEHSLYSIPISIRLSVQFKILLLSTSGRSYHLPSILARPCKDEHTSCSFIILLIRSKLVTNEILVSDDNSWKLARIRPSL